jgi:hypothetical protein
MTMLVTTATIATATASTAPNQVWAALPTDYQRRAVQLLARLALHLAAAQTAAQEARPTARPTASSAKEVPNAASCSFIQNPA